MPRFRLPMQRHLPLAVVVLLAAGAAAPLRAQFTVVGPAPYSKPMARQKIKSLLAGLTGDNCEQTNKELTRLLTWYRDIFDEELAAAWQNAGANRPALAALADPLSDSASATSIIAISWRQERSASFHLEYAPLLGSLMARYPASARPFIADLQGNADSLDLTQEETQTVCRILLDMPDIGSWRQIALQVLPRYRSVAEDLLTQDLRSYDFDKRSAATVWERDLRWGEWSHPSPLASRPSAGNSPPRPRRQPPSANPQPAPAQPAKIVTVPNSVNTVYFQNQAGDLARLERNTGVPRLPGNLHDYEINGAKSPVRFPVDSKLTFVVRMPDGVDPAVFNLFPLEATKRNRRTRPNPKNLNTPLTIGLNIAPITESTYTLAPLMGLAPGEYCLSPRTSNDCFCFGIDSPGADKKRR